MQTLRILFMATGVSLAASHLYAQTNIPATTAPVPLVEAENGATEFTPAPNLDDAELGENATTSTTPTGISISLDNVELEQAIKMFGKIANANIVANPGILAEKVISVDLDNVQWKPALSSILSMHNLALIEQPQGSGVFVVRDQPPDAPEPMTVKTIFLEYTTVNDVQAVVQSMMSPGAKLSVFPSRNAMVLRETENNLNEIMLVLKEIDILSRQVVVETQFMELNDSALKQLGVRWDSLAELGLDFSVGPFQTTRSSARNTTRTDTQQRRNTAYNLSATDERYDAFGNRVEAPERSITFPDGVEIGQDGTGTGSEPSLFTARANERSQANVSDISDEVTRSIENAGAAILNATEFSMVISALQSTDGIQVISNPKIIVESGSTNAFFSVGDREPIIRRSVIRGTADSPGDTILSELDTGINTEYINSGYLSTGIELLVVPTVKTDDFIEARIEPSLRRKLRDKEVDGNKWPEIAVKEIRTQFTLKSGQTVAIGGLTDSENSKITSKVPLLGDIPIIGKYLFSHERDATSQTETIIFVTLGLADPMKIGRNEGIPERTELLYKREVKDKIRRMEIQQELDDLKEAARDLEKRFEDRRKERSAIPPPSYRFDSDSL